MPIGVNVGVALRPERLTPPRRRRSRNTNTNKRPPRLPKPRRDWGRSLTPSAMSNFRPAVGSAADPRQGLPSNRSGLFYSAHDHFRPGSATVLRDEALHVNLGCKIGKVVGTAGLVTLNTLKKMFAAGNDALASPTPAPPQVVHVGVSETAAEVDGVLTQQQHRQGPEVVLATPPVPRQRRASSVTALSPLGNVRWSNNEVQLQAGAADDAEDVAVPVFRAKNYCHRSFDVRVEHISRDRHFRAAATADDGDTGEADAGGEASPLGGQQQQPARLQPAAWTTVPSAYAASARDTVPNADEGGASLPMPFFVRHKRTFPGANRIGDDFIGFKTAGSQLHVGLISVRLSKSLSSSSSSSSSSSARAVGNDSDGCPVTIPFSEFVVLRRNGEQRTPFYRAAIAWTRLAGTTKRQAGGARRVTKQVSQTRIVAAGFV